MSDLEPITRNEKLWSGEDLEPKTRQEMYIRHLYDETQVIPDSPKTREEMFILKAGEELHDVTIEQLTATENGTYSEEGVAYSPVIVNVPAPVLDELTVTENGTYTPGSGTDGYNEVNVNVQPTLAMKNITANGTYNASDDNADGYSSVSVNVPLPSNAYLLKSIENVNIATFADGTDNFIKSLEVAIEPVQSGSGDPSPENIRPISGWSAVDVTRTGKNLTNAKFGTQVPSVSNGQMVNVSGWSTEYIKVDNSKTYCVSVGNDETSYILYYDYNLNYLGYNQFSVYMRVDTDSHFSGASYIKLRNDASEINNPQIQLELSSTATTYEPYNGQTITIQLGDTYYGCKLDVVSGVLTVERVGVDLGTLDWNNDSQGLFVTQLPNDSQTYGYNSDLSNLMSDMWAPKVKDAGWAAMTDGQYGIATRQLRIKYSSVETTEAFATLVNGSIFVYELATPIEVQLTPTQVNSLMGVNNIWADCGNIIDGQYFSKGE